MIFRVAAALLLLAATTGAGTKLKDSNVSFKQALGACSGALGSISFALGHARVAAAPGVDSDASETSAAGTLTVMLQDASGKKSATVAIDQQKRAIWSKNVRVEMNGTVACILPD
jgi:hypothetical protein